MTSGAIVQARMGSTRLPGKVMKEAGGHPLLFYCIERVKQSSEIDRVIVATTNHSRDDRIVSYCEEQGYSYFRGSETDVLDRYWRCADKYELDPVVRVTSDCPLFDFRILDRCLQRYRQEQNVYVSIGHPRSYPHGMDVEVFPYSILHQAAETASSNHDREHVTPWIKKHSTFYPDESENLIDGINIEHTIDFSHVRLTVDYPEDLEVVRFLINNTSIEAPWQEYIALLTKYPEYIERNRQYVEH